MFLNFNQSATSVRWVTLAPLNLNIGTNYGTIDEKKIFAIFKISGAKETHLNQ